MNKFLIISGICLCSFFTVEGAAIDDAKELYNSGKYVDATKKLTELYNKTPNNIAVNQWLGMSLYAEGEYNQAYKYLNYAATKGASDALFYLGMTKYYEGNYFKAFDDITRYESLMKKGRKTIPEYNKKDLESVKLAKSMLDHVQKIVVVDSINVDKNNFFTHYKISPEIGSFKTKDVLPQSNLKSNNPVYIPQSNEKMIWSASQNVGEDSLYQSTKLLDGSWDNARIIDSNINVNGDSAYPFLMPDGTSIYFASNGEGSIGGYDIFVSGRDMETGEYYKPQNIGMPFNSPFNDYLYVIDEVTGAGWWASDRNQIPGKVTIYIFKPSDIRINYGADVENIESIALVKSIKDTWESGEDYSSLLDKIRNMNTSTVKKKKDFEFIVSNDKIYTTLNDFKSLDARNEMRNWLEDYNKFNSKQSTLEKLRFKYSKNKNNNVGQQILGLEKEILELREHMESIANDIRDLERQTSK